MYFTYILKSLKDGTYYYGHTKDIEVRLNLHNKGNERYTKGHRPYVLHYFEKFETRKEAVARERFFKSVEGYNWLRNSGIIS